MQLGLKNKKVLISGSSRGIGFGIAERFCQEGAKVLINGRSEEDLRSSSKKLNDCLYVAGNVAKPENARFVVNSAQELLGGLDILICNVGITMDISYLILIFVLRM